MADSTHISLPSLSQEGARFTLRRLEASDEREGPRAAGAYAALANFEEEDEEDREIMRRLEKLQGRVAPRKLKPGLRWNGRVGGLSLQQYREMRWGLDKGFKVTQRACPSFSMRRQLPGQLEFTQNNKSFQRGDVHAAVRATRYIGPSYSMGCLQATPSARLARPGPGDYEFNSAMDPAGHPTIPKDRGKSFTVGNPGKEALPKLTPGPGEYELRRAGNCGVASSTSVIPTKPQWSLGGREAWEPPTAPTGPEPGEYDVSTCLRNGKITPNRWSMAGRLDALPKEKRTRPSQAKTKASAAE